MKTEPVIVSGSGIKVDGNTLKNKGKKKFITQDTMFEYLHIAKRRKDDENIRPFWRIFHCNNKMVTFDGRLYTNYCKNRLCAICNSNRQAQLINKYLPVMDAWPEPYFVTLTVKGVEVLNLKEFIKEIIKGIKTIRGKCKKNFQRGRGPKPEGLRFLECSYNYHNKKYKPHFHILVANKKIAEMLIKEWLMYWKAQGLTLQKKAQISQRIEDKKQLIGIILYSTKNMVEVEKFKGLQKAIPRKVFIEATYNIFNALKGCRTIERFGIKPIMRKSKIKLETKLYKHFEKWRYNFKEGDWENELTGEKLSNYSASFQLLSYLKPGNYAIN